MKNELYSTPVLVGAIVGAILLAWLGIVSNSLALSWWALPRADKYSGYQIRILCWVVVGGLYGGISGYILYGTNSHGFKEISKRCLVLGSAMITGWVAMILADLLGVAALYFNGPMSGPVAIKYPSLFDLLPTIFIFVSSILLLLAGWGFRRRGE